jgi:hypothetical protein
MPSMTSTQDSDGRAVAHFVEEFATVLVESGVPRMPARVLACLMADDRGALTSAELSERLMISPAAVSGAVRYLSQVQMLRRTRDPGSRRELYRVDHNVLYQAIAGRGPLLAHWEHVLRGGVDAVGPDSDAGERLNETADFLQFMSREIDGMLERWRAHLAERRAAAE